jgi:uncharacterized protein
MTEESKLHAEKIQLFETNRPDTPVPQKERILYLDILRGIAILFIFLANIKILSGTNFMSDAQRLSMNTATLDHVLRVLDFLLVDGKFYSVFSILFGIGFAVQYQRMKKDDRVFVPFFMKRMTGLLLIGGIHLFLIWLGDILTLYALLGFLLISFRHFTNKNLLIWAGFLLFIPILHWLAMYFTNTFYPANLAGRFFEMAGRIVSKESTEGLDSNFSLPAYFAITNFKTWIEINLHMPLLRLSRILMEGRAFKVLGLFLIGMYAGRQILENDLLSNTRLIKKIMWWGLVIGLPMNLLRTWVEFYSANEGAMSDFPEYVLNFLGLTPMALAYCAIVALVVTRRKAWLNGFAAIGRTALSNYLFQSIISIIFFYGIGLGFAFSHGFSFSVLFVLIVFALQILFSSLWLRYFRFGPVEWIWRQLTYGKVIRLKKSRS